MNLKLFLMCRDAFPGWDGSKQARVVLFVFNYLMPHFRDCMTVFFVFVISIDHIGFYVNTHWHPTADDDETERQTWNNAIQGLQISGNMSRVFSKIDSLSKARERWATIYIFLEPLFICFMVPNGLERARITLVHYAGRFCRVNYLLIRICSLINIWRQLIRRFN